MACAKELCNGEITHQDSKEGMRSLPCLVLNLCLTLHKIGSANTYSSDSDFTCFIEWNLLRSAFGMNSINPAVAPSG